MNKAEQREVQKAVNTARIDPRFAAATLALSACAALNVGTFNVAYEHADWLLQRMASRYIDFDARQEPAVRTGFGKLHAWHRAQELPLYAQLMDSAATRVERGLRRKIFIFILLTAALGAIFLSVQVYEYSKLISEGLGLGVNMFGASFFTLTGFHGAHVSVGVLLLLITALRGWKYGFTKEYHLGVEMIGLYWHFVDLVWVLIFTLVYLLK